MSERPDQAPVGYVLTHYPKLAQTFIANEIDAVERAGTQVRVFAMNAPEAHELAREGARERAARAIYLKPAFARALGLLAAVSLRHPLAMARVWRSAVLSGGGQPRRIARRIAHLAQGALVAHEAGRMGISRLHAHFGLAPATIAWLATGIARARGRTDARFSFTIHGFHDFFDPAETRLDLKAAAADRVLCISDFTRSQLCLTTDPAWWPRFTVARCGIDTQAFAYRDPPERGGPARIMALGRLSPEKGFAVLVEALLSQGSAADLEAAHHAVDRLAAVPTEPGFVLFELPVLRLRGLLARARRDEAGHRRFTQRCLTLAREAGYEAYLG